jgi:hypothetical protein
MVHVRLFMYFLMWYEEALIDWDHYGRMINRVANGKFHMSFVKKENTYLCVKWKGNELNCQYDKETLIGWKITVF